MAALALLLAACDAGTAVDPDVPNEDVVGATHARGPSLSEFPTDALMTPEEVDALVTSQASARTSGDGAILVPLVFDENDRLHSPESFNRMQDSLLAVTADDDETGARRAGGGMPLILFTDLDTFESVVGQSETGRSRTGTGTYADLYRNGQRGQILLQEAPSQDGGRTAGLDSYTDTYDPYSIPEYDGWLCDPESGLDCAPGTSGWYTGRPIDEGRKREELVRGTGAPVYPDLWKGDILSGEKHAGGSSASSGPAKLGHDAIVTELSSGQNTGGRIDDDRTQTMEATGFSWSFDRSSEVEERPAGTWFSSSDEHDLRYVMVLDLGGPEPVRTASRWGKIDASISYARLQNPDWYGVTAPKFNRSTWYCSKLVWAAYERGFDVNIDSNGGYYVYPVDIERAIGTLSTVYAWRDPASR